MKTKVFGVFLLCGAVVFWWPKKPSKSFQHEHLVSGEKASFKSELKREMQSYLAGLESQHQQLLAEMLKVSDMNREIQDLLKTADKMYFPHFGSTRVYRNRSGLVQFQSDFLLLGRKFDISASDKLNKITERYEFKYETPQLGASIPQRSGYESWTLWEDHASGSPPKFIIERRDGKLAIAEVYGYLNVSDADLTKIPE